MPLTLPIRGTARAGSIAAGRSAPGFGFGTPTVPTVPPAAPPAGGDAFGAPSFGITTPGNGSSGYPFGYVGGGGAVDAGEDAFFDGPNGRGNHPGPVTPPPGSPLFGNPSNGGLPFGAGPGGGNTTGPDGEPLDFGELPQIPDPTTPTTPVTPSGVVVLDEVATDGEVGTHRPEPVSSAARTAVVLAILAGAAMILVGVLSNRRPRSSRRSSSRKSSTATRRNARGRKAAR